MCGKPREIYEGEMIQGAVVRKILAEYNNIVERELLREKLENENNRIVRESGVSLLELEKQIQINEYSLTEEEEIILSVVDDSKKYLPEKAWEQIRFGNKPKTLEAGKESALEQYYLYFSLTLVRRLDEKNLKNSFKENKFWGH